jgi:hypothetical protein
LEILQQLVAGIDRPEAECKICAGKNIIARAIELVDTFENLDANVRGFHTPTEHVTSPWRTTSRSKTNVTDLPDAMKGKAKVKDIEPS